jgi:uncharacterized protein
MASNSNESNVSAPLQMQWGVRVPLRDGVHLNATLYLPDDHPTPSPTIVTLTPYVSQTYHEQGVYFASHGFPFLGVDVRGRGNSDGEFRPLIQEARDGYDVVEWLAQQPYSNGQVTMWGGSYAGYNQWMTAKELPPHLATIVPVAAPYLGVDTWMRSNIAYPYLMRWLILVWGRTAQEKLFWGDERFWNAKFLELFESGAAFKQLDTAFGCPSEIFQEWVSHPCVDDYWDRYNPTSEDYAKLELPILTITGIYDSDQPGALQHYREHLRYASEAARSRHYLVIGPWNHAGTRVPQRNFAGVEFGEASLVDLQALHCQWYAWTMLGKEKPGFLKKLVAYYVTGAECWRYADTLEAVTANFQTLFLGSTGNASQILSSGVMAGELNGSAEDIYRYDPRDTTLAPLEAAATDPVCLRPTFPTENLTDQTLVYAKERQRLVYHSASFNADTEVSGFFKLSAWISIDQPDTDFGVSIYEIDRHGRSLLLTFDCLRARYRQSLREEKLLRTTEPLRYDFERFTFVSRLIRKGSRLRLVIGPLDSIHFQKNYNSGGVVHEETISDARTVTVKLFHDAAHPSALSVPIGHGFR